MSHCELESGPGGLRPGLFIVVEGIDGTGKSTLVAGLAEALRLRGAAVRTSAEPTKGPYGLQLRALQTQGRQDVSAEQEMELFIKDRQQHIQEVIAPSLAQGQVVILDRYYFSTMAYQGARGMDPQEIRRRHEAFAPSPDVLVLLDLTVQAALDRIIRKRGEQPNAYEGAEYLARVRDIFLGIKHPGLLHVDASQTTDQMVSQIMARLETWLESLNVK